MKRLLVIAVVAASALTAVPTAHASGVRAYVLAAVENRAQTGGLTVPLTGIGLTPSGTSDLGGGFTSGTPTGSSLNGPHFTISDACGAPAGTTASADGDIVFSQAIATNCSFGTTGHATRAAVTSMHYLEVAHQLASTWATSAGMTSFLASNVTVNVNINQTCNAYWDGTTVNLMRNGNGCANTGEDWDAATVSYATGLDQSVHGGVYANIGSVAKQVAVSDVFAALVSHDPCIAPGFFVSGSGGETSGCVSALRDLRFAVTATSLFTQCTSGTGEYNAEPHCASHLLSGALWDLSQALVTRYGTTEGWHVFERLFFASLPNYTAVKPTSAGDAYDAWLAADDDNDDLQAGTPNGDLIYTAFHDHGIAGSDRGQDVTACGTRPAPPSWTTARSATGPVLTWSAAAGTTYDVWRDDADDEAPVFLPLATGVTSQFTDTQTRPASSYRYELVAQQGGCASAFGTPTTVPGYDGTNQPPTTEVVGAATRRAQATSFVLPGRDPEAGPLAFAVTVKPTHGSTTGTLPNVTYTPDKSFTGTDGIDFTVTDDHAQQVTGHVTLTVQPDDVAPTTTGPGMTLEVGHQMGAASTPVTIRWNGHDNLDTALQYEVGESRATTAGGLGTITMLPGRLTSPGLTRLESTSWLEFGVRAYDTDGNVGVLAVGPRQKVAPTQENASTVAYHGAWGRVQRGGAFGGYVETTSTAGAYAVFTFTGRSVAVAMPHRTDLGKARICLDKGLATQSCTDVNLAGTSIPRLLVWTRNALSTAKHTVTVTRLTGRLDLDAFGVLSARV